MARPVIDLDELQKEVSTAKETFDKWAHSNAAAAASLKAKHQNTAREARATIQALQERQQRLAMEVDNLRLRLQNEKAREHALAHELEILRGEEADIPRHIQELQRLIAQEEERAAREASGAAMELSAAAHHVEEMRTQLRMLEESMGLRIEQVPAQGLLRFTFIFVDPRDPLRRFTFLLQLVGDATYVVHECTPEVPQLPELLDGLNRNPTMFYSFVRGMRRAFKATLQA